MSERQVKEVCLITVSLIYNGLYFGWLSRAGIFPSPLWEGMALLAATLLFTALLVISLALVTGTFTASSLVVGVPLLVTLVSTEFINAAGAALVVLAGLLYARWHIQYQLSERLRYRTVPTFYTGARWLLFSLAAATAGLVAPAVVELMRTEVIAIPERYVAQVLRPVDSLLAAAPGQVPSVVEATTTMLNRYLANTLPANPQLAATVALSAAFLTAHLIIPWLVWPVLAAVSLTMLAARRLKLVHVLTHPAHAQRLSLEPESTEHA